jgi:hypothetical protein
MLKDFTDNRLYPRINRERVLHLQSTAYESSTVDRMMIHWLLAQEIYTIKHMISYLSFFLYEFPNVLT